MASGSIMWLSPMKELEETNLLRNGIQYHGVDVEPTRGGFAATSVHEGMFRHPVVLLSQSPSMPSTHVNFLPVPCITRRATKSKTDFRQSSHPSAVAR